MAISYVGAAATVAASVGTTSSGAITLPSGIAAGDVLILAVHRTHNYALTQGTPTGYTFVRNILDTATAPNAAQTDFYYRICDGSEGVTGPTFTTATGTRWIVHAAAYRGVDAAAPFITENGQPETSGTVVADHSAPAITNTNANAWAVWSALARPGVTTAVSWTPPTGMTERLDTDAAIPSGVTIGAEWADSASTVGTGAVTYTGTTSVNLNVANMWAAFLNPAAVATPVTGTGAVALPAVTVAGAATLRVNGSGAVVLAPVVVAGAATLRVNGTGAVALAPVVVTGAATVRVNGTGAVSLAPVAVSGTTTLRLTGTGAIELAPITVAGSGTVGSPSITGSGAVTLPSVVVAGSGTLRVNGSGAVTLAPVVVAGTAALRVNGSGAVTLPSAVVAGSAALRLTGTGAVALAPITVSGAGQITPAYDPAAHLWNGADPWPGPHSGNVTGTGAIVLAPVAVAGSGTLRLTGTGAVALTPITVAGSGSVGAPTITGTGAIVLAMVLVSGAGTVSADAGHRLLVAGVWQPATVTIV